MSKLNYKNSISIVIVFFIIVYWLFIPQIIVTNKIYYISKEINKKYVHYIALKEENKLLKQQLEDARFKNRVLDTLLIIDID